MLSCNHAKPVTLLPPKPAIHATKYYSCIKQQKYYFNHNSEKKRPNVCVAASANPTTLALGKSVARDSFSIQVNVRGLFPPVDFAHPLDDAVLTLNLELISTELDPLTGKENERLKGSVSGTMVGNETCETTLVAYLEVAAGFGDVGAVTVENEHHKDVYLHDIILQGFPHGPVTFSCKSWVHSKDVNPTKRIFFTTKSHLPSATPDGLKMIREQELENLRGCGDQVISVRKPFDRIYDYDKYNDLGDPDQHPDLKRPVLGGYQHPYPRRCRTGRSPAKTDRSSESRTGTGAKFYVPSDEAFSRVKESSYRSNLIKYLQKLKPPVIGDASFPSFFAIDKLFYEGVELSHGDVSLAKVLPGIVKSIEDTKNEILLYDLPQLLDQDKFSWLSDEEFGRQTLAGLNPLGIQLITKWPLKSELDPQKYGTAESMITKEIVEKEIGGSMIVEEAIKQKKLFILDYHDILLPYVAKVRELQDSTLYGSRTLFFLADDGTLIPVAIELTRPPIDNKPEWKHVFVPSNHSTDCWLWRLAKAHVLAHDTGIHQLVSHWLRTHCVVEPYIIAANRQLSEMHPIYRLLHPHFRYTMEINALARGSLINAGGIIESTFFPGKYSMELSSVAYDKLWRFHTEALPADLIKRGMAIEDPTAEHGLKLTIEDYPYANDGLLLWDATKQWVSEYVNHYYREAENVVSDNELQKWWEEVRVKGHEDKKDEPWWPVLNTQQNLIQVLTTIIWVSSGHHAAVNFGQYAYGAYFPNRPTISRANIPTEDMEPNSDEYKNLLKKPEKALLRCFPNLVQATTVMGTLYVLSSHSPDEEYIGKTMEASWEADSVIKIAYEMYAARITMIEAIIHERNSNPKNKNRVGAGVVPYQLLKPFSPESGVTGMGVPNSISI